MRRDLSSGGCDGASGCRKAAPIPTGAAVLTPGFNLPAKYIIHAAGPVYRSWDAAQSERLLRSAYLESLRLARRHRCVSIAFPLISSGIYGYPKEDALRVATAAIREFLMEHEMDVYLAIFDKASFAISRKLAGAVESYIDENYVFSHQMLRRGLLEVEREALEAAAPLPMAASSGMPGELDRLIGNLDEPFHVALLKLIDAKAKPMWRCTSALTSTASCFPKSERGRDTFPASAPCWRWPSRCSSPSGRRTSCWSGRVTRFPTARNST